ncbi:SprT-like domain-containing protein [Micromonospora sp. WMMD1082]|uniref:SprT-like domain-containing protein n=1 Tax=Micromonospora sp. WMMD1082 TaxID=3016104 RepID=UPI002417684C|nr:SprT-like domain-containing protein [Micromonospora sp. WMMD1082]MDG4792735.1 SprT-like domain-containing protein [Micromonospora sp. WMMD1082]
MRVSVGWPGVSSRKRLNKVIGQCWASHTTADKTPQVFVSPVLADAGQVLETLAHELIHAWDDCKSGHRGDFAKLARRIGLTGKMTATVAGDELKARLDEIADQLGEYPHARLSTATRDGQGEKKQTTRMIKCECTCGYLARTSRKWLDEVGAPICPRCRTEMPVYA